MKNLYLIPTDEPSTLYEFGGQYNIHPIAQKNFRGYNIYITSDDEIDDDEYGVVLSLVREGFKSHQAVFKMDDGQREAMMNLGGQEKAEVKKVILTTDPKLINDGVDAIDDTFLEWFIKNPTCEFAKIEKCFTKISEAFYGYEIIIPETICEDDKNIIKKEEYDKALAIIEAYNNQINSKIVTNRVCCICKNKVITKMNDNIHPLKQEQGMWNDGVVEKITFGYGSKHDMNSYYIAICDNCIDELENDGLATNLKVVKKMFPQ